jgi:transcriptional regulator with GAF, ATPase, and Fis domain
MPGVVVVGDADLAATAVCHLDRINLNDRRDVSLVVAAGDHDRLAPLLSTLGQVHRRLMVVAVEEPPPSVLDEVLMLTDDYLDWDEGAVESIECRLERWREIDDLLESEPVRRVAAGQSRAHLDALAQIAELARHSDAPVLISGETGTGKEVAARLLHDLGSKADRPFVVVAGGTLRSELSGSELFGHDRGAFTGAVSSRMGAFALANGGTLFLDEVGELPHSIQLELLRVIQEGTYKRVGGDKWLKSSFRLVCATNRDLDVEVEAGRFREDLYHRIAGGRVHLTPLRERVDDVEPLFIGFLKDVMPDSPPELAPSVVRLLRCKRYPGNLRDLRQLAVRVASRHAGPGPITLGDFPKPDRRWVTVHRLDEPDEEGVLSSEPFGAEELHRRAVATLMASGRSMKEVGRLVSDLMVDIALDRSNGSTRAAAQLLGVTERAVQLRKAAVRGSLSDGDSVVAQQT